MEPALWAVLHVGRVKRYISAQIGPRLDLRTAVRGTGRKQVWNVKYLPLVMVEQSH